MFIKGPLCDKLSVEGDSTGGPATLDSDLNINPQQCMKDYYNRAYTVSLNISKEKLHAKMKYLNELSLFSPQTLSISEGCAYIIIGSTFGGGFNILVS